MRYSIEPRKRRHVKGCGFLSFDRNIGTHAAKVTKNMSNKYSEKLDTAKKSATDAIKTASKRAIQKTADATGDIKVNNEIPKERYISPKERQKIIDELRLI